MLYQAISVLAPGKEDWQGVSLQSYSAAVRPRGWREAVGRQAKGNDKKRKHGKSLTYREIVSQKFIPHAIVWNAK